MDNQPAGHHLKVRGMPPQSDNNPHPRPPAAISMATHRSSARPHTHPRMAVSSAVATCCPGNRFGLGVLVAAYDWRRIHSATPQRNALTCRDGCAFLSGEGSAIATLFPWRSSSTDHTVRSTSSGLHLRSIQTEVAHCRQGPKRGIATNPWGLRHGGALTLVGIDRDRSTACGDKETLGAYVADTEISGDGIGSPLSSPSANQSTHWLQVRHGEH